MASSTDKWICSDSIIVVEKLRVVQVAVCGLAGGTLLALQGQCLELNWQQLEMGRAWLA